MPWVAYYGNLSDRIYGRIEWQSEYAARMDCWNHSHYYGLHDTDKEVTHQDRFWDSEVIDYQAKERQLSLFKEAAP